VNEPTPQRATPSLAVLIVLITSLLLALAVVTFLGSLGFAGVIMLAAVLIAYLIFPAVQLLKRFIPTIVAISITYLIFVVLIAAVSFIVVPPLIDQARDLIVSVPALVRRLTDAIADPNNRLFSRLPSDVRAYIVGLPDQAVHFISTYGIIVVQRTFNVLLSTVSLSLSLIIVPILAAYLLFDAAEMKRAVLGFVPQRARAKALAIASDLNDAIGAFVRGQLLDGAIVAVMIAVMLYLMHVPYALLIGVSAGFLNLVPYLGSIAGFIPSVLLALGYNGWQSALGVAILFAVIQQIDGTFILPRIMKANVSLSPVVIIVSILVGTALFGVVGTFLAVPVAAMLRVVKVHFAPAPPPAEMVSLEMRARTLTIPQ
jgi:predicted PurR-regulated permease PerM